MKSLSLAARLCAQVALKHCQRRRTAEDPCRECPDRACIFARAECGEQLEIECPQCRNHAPLDCPQNRKCNRHCPHTVKADECACL